MRKKALIILAEKNFNEKEFLSLKYQFGKKKISFFIASDATGLCTGNHGMKVKADINLVNIHPANFDGLAIPGGNGILHYSGNSKIAEVITQFNKSSKLIGAICAAPVLLAKAGILSGREATCHPEYKDILKSAGTILSQLDLVQDKNIITASTEESSTAFAELFTNSILVN